MPKGPQVVGGGKNPEKDAHVGEKPSASLSNAPVSLVESSEIGSVKVQGNRWSLI